MQEGKGVLAREDCMLLLRDLFLTFSDELPTQERVGLAVRSLSNSMGMSEDQEGWEVGFQDLCDWLPSILSSYYYYYFLHRDLQLYHNTSYKQPPAPAPAPAPDPASPFVMLCHTFLASFLLGFRTHTCLRARLSLTAPLLRYLQGPNTSKELLARQVKAEGAIERR